MKIQKIALYHPNRGEMKVNWYKKKLFLLIYSPIINHYNYKSKTWKKSKIIFKFSQINRKMKIIKNPNFKAWYWTKSKIKLISFNTSIKTNNLNKSMYNCHNNNLPLHYKLKKAYRKLKLKWKMVNQRKTI